MGKIVDDLSDEELKTISNLLKQGESLPDEYRFRLFDSCHISEIIWPGKSRNICKADLPFQTIEYIDAPKLNQLRHNFSPRNCWSNKLIWGDNKLILSSMRNGALRSEIEAQGGIKLVYIDPPFDVGANFSTRIEIGENNSFTKQPSVIEEIAYRDTWGKGTDSFLSMIYERLVLIKELLANDGSIYIHCDWHVCHSVKVICDEIFGKANYLNEVIWKKLATPKAQTKGFGNIHDTVLVYSKSDEIIFNDVKIEHAIEYIQSMYRHTDEDGRRYRLSDFTQKGSGPARRFGKKTINPPHGKHWIWSQERIDAAFEKGMIIFSKNGIPSVKRYLDEVEGHRVSDLWTDIKPMSSTSQERTNYDTQKPESLLERILLSSSNRGDLVADFFCGSGTTMAVAERLDRRWIGCDLSRFAIHTSRKRLINIQCDLKSKNIKYIPFEIINLGHYDRQYYMGIDPSLPKKQRERQARLKENQYYNLIHRAYKSEPLHNMPPFHGVKSENNHAVYIGSLESPVTLSEIEEVIKNAKKYKFKKVDVLGFEFEMGLSPDMQDRAKKKGVDLVLRFIPREVFDKRAVDKGQVIFYDVSYVEAKIIKIKNTASVKLTDFGVFYRQENIEEVTQTLKSGGSKVVVDQGQVVKLTKNRKGIIERELLTKNWIDWIDYWSVDFDYESMHDKFSGNNIFENQWQNFRTKSDRKITTESDKFTYSKSGQYKVAIKVIDIFGHDTTKVIDIKI